MKRIAVFLLIALLPISVRFPALSWMNAVVVRPPALLLIELTVPLLVEFE